MSIIMPQDTSRQDRCKCTQLTQWLSRISGYTATITPYIPSVPPESIPVAHVQVAAIPQPSPVSPKLVLQQALLSGDSAVIQAALSNYPDPLQLIKLAISYYDLTRTSQNRLYYFPRINLLQGHIDNYLKKQSDHFRKSAQKNIHDTILAHTPFSTVLVNIINDYVDTSAYLLPKLAMQYLGKKIITRYPRPEDPTLAIIPCCIDEAGNNMLCYVSDSPKHLKSLIYYGIDLFCNENASDMWKKSRLLELSTTAIRNHVKRLQQDSISFTCPIEQELFFHTISNAVVPPSPTFIDMRVIRGISEIKRVDNFEQSVEYQLIRDYTIAAPSLLTMHDAKNQSIFDHADAACDPKSRQVIKVNALLQLLLECKADPNLQNTEGNTFLHRVALDERYFSAYHCPSESPFIQKCMPQLNLAIANNDRQTVFDILESQIKYCNEHKKFNTRKYCQKFMDKLTTLKTSHQVTTQSTTSKPSGAHSVYPGEHKDFPRDLRPQS